MNIKENISEGIRSIKSNMLRTVLTAAIIAFGITALVGILTTIDGMQASVNSSFADLGANTFDIKIEQRRGRRSGVVNKQQVAISYRQANDFKALFTQKVNGIVSISAQVAGAAQVKYASKKTNPNTRVVGIDEGFLGIKGYTLQSGRTINERDIESSARVVILGSEVVKLLFANESPINKDISILNDRYRVIGVLESKGSLSGGGDDRDRTGDLILTKDVLYQLSYKGANGRSWVRTSVHVSEQIYSLPPLTTRPSSRKAKTLCR